MNHKVQSVQALYEDATELFRRHVLGSEETSADSIINNLNDGIGILKNCWKGKDAGVQINNIVTVFNGMIDVRNALLQLATDSSKIASNYREIQNSNGANLEALAPLLSDVKTKLPEYVDPTPDTVSITPEANNGKAKVDAAANAMGGFIQNVMRTYDKIMENWTVGTGREKAIEAFNSFQAKSKSYEKTLMEVSQSISTAVKNYSF